MPKIWVATVSRSGSPPRALGAAFERKDILLHIRRFIFSEVEFDRSEQARAIRDRLSRDGAGDVINACQLLDEYRKVTVNFTETEIVEFSSAIHETWNSAMKSMATI